MRLTDLFEKKSLGPLNPRNEIILKRIKAKHPQAKSELDALIAELHSGQKQDRSDITRLDRENDRDEYEINRLEAENEMLTARLTKLEQELDALKNTK